MVSHPSVSLGNASTRERRRLAERLRPRTRECGAFGGGSKTFYLPETGDNGGRGTGFWRATGTWYSEHPGGLSTVGSKTVTIFRTI